MFPVPLPRVNGVTIVLPLLPWLTFTLSPHPITQTTTMDVEKLKKLAGSVRMGGKGTMRRYVLTCFRASRVRASLP